MKTNPIYENEKQQQNNKQNKTFLKMYTDTALTACWSASMLVQSNFTSDTFDIVDGMCFGPIVICFWMNRFRLMENRCNDIFRRRFESAVESSESGKSFAQRFSFFILLKQRLEKARFLSEHVRTVKLSYPAGSSPVISWEINLRRQHLKKKTHEIYFHFSLLIKNRYIL